MPYGVKDQRAKNKVKNSSVRMASGPFQHRDHQMIPTRGHSCTDGWWLQVSEIGRQCHRYLRMRHSTINRRHVWSQTLRRHKYQCFQSYWLEDMALCEAWVLGLFHWSGEFCSAARRMTWRMYAWLGKCACHCDIPSQRLTTFPWLQGQPIRSLAISTCQPCRLLIYWYAGWVDRPGKNVVNGIVTNNFAGCLLAH